MRNVCCVSIPQIGNLPPSHPMPNSIRVFVYWGLIPAVHLRQQLTALPKPLFLPMGWPLESLELAPRTVSKGAAGRGQRKRSTTNKRCTSVTILIWSETCGRFRRLEFRCVD